MTSVVSLFVVYTAVLGIEYCYNVKNNLYIINGWVKSCTHIYRNDEKTTSKIRIHRTHLHTHAL